MNVDAAVQPLLVQQVVKSLLETSELKDSPFAALLTTALAGEVGRAGSK
jgi:hypothetical protein